MNQPPRHQRLEPGRAPHRDAGRTRERILAAAVTAFSEKGLDGARVDQIAAGAGANKRMIYHYFGNKEGLYLAALETVYQAIRQQERALELDHLPPAEAMRALLHFTWQHFIDHPEFIGLLNAENLQQARTLKRSARIAEMHSPLIDMISAVLRRGQAEAAFRSGIDPVQLYISIAALGYFYHSNVHTLSTIFARDLRAPEALAERCDHMVAVIMGYLERRR